MFLFCEKTIRDGDYWKLLFFLHARTPKIHILISSTFTETQAQIKHPIIAVENCSYLWRFSWPNPTPNAHECDHRFDNWISPRNIFKSDKTFSNKIKNQWLGVGKCPFAFFPHQISLCSQSYLALISKKEKFVSMGDSLLQYTSRTCFGYTWKSNSAMVQA